MILAYFRNDDVRGVLDDSLIYLTEKMVSAGFPISHAVEPANVTHEVAEWLLGTQKSYPEYVEIHQHGFDHTIKTTPPFRGEFGRGRSFDDQLNDIQQGAELMNLYFRDRWTRIFSFPYGAYNAETLKALELSEFKIISTGMRFTFKKKILNAIGHALHVKQLLGRNIVYFNKQIPRSSVYEVPVVINNTKRQIGPNTGIQLTTEELCLEWERLPRSLKIRGILCHHRFNTRKDIDQLTNFMMKLQSKNVHFLKIGNVHEKMDNM